METKHPRCSERATERFVPSDEVEARMRLKFAQFDKGFFGAKQGKPLEVTKEKA